MMLLMGTKLCMLFALAAGVAARRSPTVGPPMDSVTPLEALDWEDEGERAEALARIKNLQPTLIKNSGIGGSLVNKWTGDYLSKHWDEFEPMAGLSTSMRSVNGNFLFPYRDRFERGQYNAAKIGESITFNNSVTEKHLTMTEYLALPREQREKQYIVEVLTKFPDEFKGDHLGGDHGQLIDMPGGEPEVNEDQLGEVITTDVLEELHWETLEEVLQAGKMMPNGIPEMAFWAGAGSSTSPLHFDTFPGVMLQLGGCSKTFYLWPPENFPQMYLFPRIHPGINSQVLDIWDHEANAREFPEFLKAEGGLSATLENGHVLFTPGSWWHDVQGMADKSDSVTTSLSWQSYPTDADPHIDALRIAKPNSQASRNLWGQIIEENLAQQLGNPESIAYLAMLDEYSNKDGINEAFRAKHQKIMNWTQENIPSMQILREGETSIQFLKWLARNRFKELMEGGKHNTGPAVHHKTDRKQATGRKERAVKKREARDRSAKKHAERMYNVMLVGSLTLAMLAAGFVAWALRGYGKKRD